MPTATGTVTERDAHGDTDRRRVPDTHGDRDADRDPTTPTATGRRRPRLRSR
jgi:hypothetical protein